MSMDISVTTADLTTNLKGNESTQSQNGKITSIEIIDIQRSETVVATPPLGAEIFIPTKKSDETDWEALLDTEVTAKPKSKKPRLTVKEYMSSQKLYDVLKDPENGLPAKTSLSLKSKNRRSLIPFSSFINVTVNEQRATNITGVLGAKPTVTVKLATDDSIAATSPTTSLDETATTKIPNVHSLTSPVFTTNLIELSKGAKSSVVMPYKSDNSNSEPTKINTAKAETKSSNSKTTSPVSTAITTNTINDNSKANTATTVTTSANTTKYIAKNGTNTANLATSHKKSVMRSVNIPLSIASKAHKSLVLKGLKMPIHPLSKSRNCVLLSTSSNTDANKGIIKFIPRNSFPAKYVSDRNNDANTNDSNSNEAFSGKEAEKLTTVKSPKVDKEVLVITTDVNTKKAAVNKIVPLVGKRKYTDPDAMPPILSFSYQKSLSEYIRKAKEFHKHDKICSTTIDNCNNNKEEHVENMISNNIERLSTQDGSEMDGQQKVVGIKANNETETTDKIGKVKCRGTVEDLDASNDMETAEDIDNINEMEYTASIGNLNDVKLSEGNKNLNDNETTKSAENLKVEETKNDEVIESIENVDNLKVVESTAGTKIIKHIEYVESTEKLKDVESVECPKNEENIESSGDTVRHRDVESAEGNKVVKDVESVNIKDVKSTKGTLNLEYNELTEIMDNHSEVESADAFKDVKDIVEGEPENTINLNNVEPTEDSNSLKYPTDGTENVDDMKSDEDATTTTDMSNQIDIESDLFTYEIFNNVSGISNATSRNEHTQTKDSTIKILRNIFELKEKVQQQAEEIMSLKAAMKLLNTPSILNKR